MSIVMDQKVLNTERLINELQTQIKAHETAINALEARLMILEEHPRKPSQKAKLFEQNAAI
jgi:flagellar biosynthesis chaperone FliJ